MKTVKYLLTAIILSSFLSFNSLGQGNNNFEISKNLDIYTTLFRELNANYVDEINPGDLMLTGIESMLKSLDPYTVYIPESRVEDYKLITTGQYGGIGALIHTKDEHVVISEPYYDFPAQKSGLKAGDRILEVNGDDAAGKNSSEVSEILKGQPGTAVKLKIERLNEKEPLSFEIVREKIKIDNIPYYGMLNNHIGYIKLTGFTQNAGTEVKKALLELKKNEDLSGLILDLRGNGGGLLHEAVNISNIFIDKGNLVVSTKGKVKTRNQDHYTRYPATDKNIPLAILVNGGSASASEIVAGAMQDLDRAVVIGQKTFGKGLVQNVIPLSYNAQVKITVAKYYIPSGRCIQAIDYSHKNGNGGYDKIPDSLINEFQTRNGRRVFDGGGIDPDIKLEENKFSNIATSLYTKYLIFDFATIYASENGSIASPDQFEISNEIFEAFVEYISDKDYDYTTKCEEKLEDLEKAAKQEHYYEAMKDEYNQLFKVLMHNKEEDLYTFQDEIKDLLKLEIISRYYYQKGKIISTLHDDPEISKAIEVLEDQTQYDSILVGTYKEKIDQEPNEG
jgi:carboxyl-terminal processing protease